MSLPFYRVRWAIKKDTQAILRADGDTNAPAMTEDDLCAFLKQSSNIGLVLEDSEGKIIGYVIYMLTKGVLTIKRLAVAPEHRRKGGGTYLINRLIAKLSEQGRRSIRIAIEETDLNTQLFLKKRGFRWIETLPEEPPHRVEYLMEYSLISNPNNRITNADI